MKPEREKLPPIDQEKLRDGAGGMSKDEVATCRGCGRALRGKPFYMGGSAYHPDTGKRCPTNHFGGFVCSEQCDRRACLDQLSSMPGAGPAKQLDGYCSRSVQANWADAS